MPAEHRVLGTGWEIAASAPDRCPGPDTAHAQLEWRPALSGTAGGLTVAGALGATAVGGEDLDARDWWFRVPLSGEVGEGTRTMLHLDGVATVSEVYLGDLRVLDSDSMFTRHQLDISDALAAGARMLTICCRALVPRLARRRRPRARWRTRAFDSGNLRFHRTMLLGRAPGFAPGPAVVGPWRGVRLEHRSGVVCERLELRTRVDGPDGVLSVRGALQAVAPAALPAHVTVSAGAGSARLEVAANGCFAGEHRILEARLWWPHTHGAPALHPVLLSAEEPGDRPRETLLRRTRVGFRSLEAAADLLADGPALRLGGVPVFCRGAVWTPTSLADPCPGRAVIRPLLESLRDAGMNMLRVVGTGCYESEAFHELCDELGILVWQDLMFANLDYPESDPEFMASVSAEVAAELSRLAAHPSTAIICGSSEVAQQVAMLGLDPTLAEGPLYGDLLPRLVREAGFDGPWIPSAPWGGRRPFRTDRGVANYFGIGAYLREPFDARAADLRFASECLAFANVPDGPVPDGGVFGPEWKRGVPRDVGAGWDFDDVRDHYLRTLYAVEPAQLRYSDPQRYLELSRHVTGEVMAEAFGEWRREASRCQGALVLWAKDLLPGAGWGLLDDAGAPKAALGVLARVLAPRCIWTTDEGLNGIAVHIGNDLPEPLEATLRVTLYREGAIPVETGERRVRVEPHRSISLDAEEVIGRFLDIGWAYRFGPPAGDVVCVSLQDDCGDLLAQTFRFPVGRPLKRRTVAELSLVAIAQRDDDGRVAVRIGCERLAYGVRIGAPGWLADDDGFCVEPGHPRLVLLRPRGDAGSVAVRGRVTALNCAASVPFTGGG